jgi:hypothetical protein
MLEENHAYGHFSLSGAKLCFVQDAMLFGICHEAFAKEFTQAYIEIGFD